MGHHRQEGLKVSDSHLSLPGVEEFLGSRLSVLKPGKSCTTRVVGHRNLRLTSTYEGSPETHQLFLTFLFIRNGTRDYSRNHRLRG